MLNLCTTSCEDAKEAAEATRADFALPALLASTTLSAGYTEADVLGDLESKPLRYQLQARILPQESLRPDSFLAQNSAGRAQSFGRLKMHVMSSHLSICPRHLGARAEDLRFADAGFGMDERP